MFPPPTPTFPTQNRCQVFAAIYARWLFAAHLHRQCVVFVPILPTKISLHVALCMIPTTHAVCTWCTSISLSSQARSNVFLCRTYFIILRHVLWIRLECAQLERRMMLLRTFAPTHPSRVQLFIRFTVIMYMLRKNFFGKFVCSEHKMYARNLVIYLINKTTFVNVYICTSCRDIRLLPHICLLSPE